MDKYKNMKFTCTRENLAYALDVVSAVAGKQANLPILSNILISVIESKVECSATNLEIAVKTHLRAKVEGGGSFTVPAKTLADYVHLLTGEQVDVELDENELKVLCGNSSTKIKGTPADEYPVIPDIEEAHAYVVEVDDLRRALSTAVVAVAKNEIRPELSGVYCGFLTDRYNGLTVAATDSYRLSEVRVPIAQGADKDVRCIIPGRVVYEIIRLLMIAKDREGEKNVRVWVSDNQFALRYDEFELSSRLIDGTYPDYAQIIPTSFKTNALFPRDVMVNKIKAASLFTTTGINAVSFDFNTSQGTIGVSSTSTQTGEHSSEIDGEVKGEENSILLNHRYVLEGLQHVDTDEVELNMNSADAPCLFKPKGREGFVYLVMPIRQ